MLAIISIQDQHIHGWQKNKQNQAHSQKYTETSRMD